MPHSTNIVRSSDSFLIGKNQRVKQSRWGHFKRIMLLVFVYCDMTTVRALMALASLLFAVGCIPDCIWPNSIHLFDVPRLVVPAFSFHGFEFKGVALLGWDIHTPGPLGVFSRPLYAGMSDLAPDWIWGLLFLLHALGVVWRFLDDKRRIYWALAINTLGSSLWFVTTMLMNAQVGEFVPSMALEWVMVAALFIALARTGLNEEKSSP